MKRPLLVLALGALLSSGADPAAAAGPTLYRTPGHEAPVGGAPGDLLLIPGSGLEATDRVVYEAVDAEPPGERHPARIPAEATAVRGLAPVENLDPYALTVQLPGVLQPRRPYHLWVVTPQGEWSQPLTINDPRPQWITPAYTYASAELAHLGRTVRVVGRNLAPRAGHAWIRLQGPDTYVLRVVSNAGDGSAEQDYVREAPLPAHLAPGRYGVAVSDDRRTWTPVASQQFEVRPDPAPLPRFEVTGAAFGGCQPNDGRDDTDCFANAIQAAARAGGGIVEVPAGRWDLTTAGARSAHGLILSAGVDLQGAGTASTIVIRHGAHRVPAPGPLLTVLGSNTIEGLTFRDAEPYASIQESRAVIQLGLWPPSAPAPGVEGPWVQDVVITGDVFDRVGRAMVDSGRPIRHLFVTHNRFAAYDNALLLTGGAATLSEPFRIDDSVVRGNRFLPGSFLGTIATQLGAGDRVDFSTNIAAGESTAGLQEPPDMPGWRAAFFWNLSNSVEDLLISENDIRCSGDKTGDGEAVSLDGSHNTSGFLAAQPVAAAGPDWVQVSANLEQRQFGQHIPPGYYDGHWLVLVGGPGTGQARKITGYTEDPASGTVTLRVSPAWDVVPTAGRSQLFLEELFWHVYIVANTVTQHNPPCRKTNLSSPRGGVLSTWAPIADSAFEGNWQTDTDGIQFLQDYRAGTRSCRGCVSIAETAMEVTIRSNVIDGEYDWSSDCSWSGVRGYFVATATPESPPPILGFGSVIAHNTIIHADGQRGGAIDIARAGQPGPPPGRWPMIQSLLVFQNTIRDISGPLPRQACRGSAVRARAGIRIEGPGNVRDTVLEGNRCERVDRPLEDQGDRTRRICQAPAAGSCECTAR